MKFLDETEADDPILSVVNLIDVFLVVIAALLAGMATEGYVFAALMFWIFCFGMSRYSLHLERKLDTGHKR